MKVNQWMGYDDYITKQELKKGVEMLICFVFQRVISTYENTFIGALEASQKFVCLVNVGKVLRHRLTLLIS